MDVVTVAAPGPSVLLIGDVGMHLEVHCIAHGLGSTFAPTASACVELLKKRRFDFLVLPPSLPDSTPDMFCLWVLQHYGDVVVLLYRDEAEGDVLATFGKQGRFVRIPTNTEGRNVAQLITQSWSSSKKPALAPLPPPPGKPTTGVQSRSSPSPFEGLPALAKPIAPSMTSSPPSSLPRSPSSTSLPRSPSSAAMPVVAGKLELPTLPLDAMSPLPLPSADPFATPGSTLVLDPNDMLSSKEARALDAENMQSAVVEQELAALRQQIATLTSERDKAEAARADAVSARDRTAASLREAEADRELATSHAKKAEDARERSVVEVRQLQRDLDTARADLMSTRADVMGLQHDLAEVRAERDRLLVSDAQHVRDRADVEERARTLADAAARLEADMKAQSEAAAAAAKQQADTIARLEREKASLESKLNTELVTTADGKKLVEHNQRKLETRIAQLTKDLEEATKKAEDARDEMFQARQLRDDAEMHATTLETDLVEARTHAREAARLRGELEATTRLHGAEKERGDGLAKELLIVQRDLATARGELDDRRSTTSSAAEQVRALEGRNRELQDKLADSFARSLAEKAEIEEELSAKIAELEKQLITAQVDAQASVQAQFVQRINELEAERDDARAKLAQNEVTAPGQGPVTQKDLERELHKMRGLYAQITVERDAANEQVEKLKAELAKKRADAATTPVMPKAASRSATMELEMLEQKLEDVTRERDQALAALTEAGRKLMALEDRVD